MKCKYLGEAEIISFWELTEAEQKEFEWDKEGEYSYVRMPEKQGRHTASGEQVFCLGDFIRTIHDKTFHGIAGDTNTSGYGIKINDECDSARIWLIW